MPDFTADSNIIYDGIDVSNYQGVIDFAQVRSSGIEAVYIKAGEGGHGLFYRFYISSRSENRLLTTASYSRQYSAFRIFFKYFEES